MSLPVIEKKRFIRTMNQKAPKYLRAEIINRIISNAQKDRYRVLFQFLWQTGVRISEALSITTQDIDWHLKQVRVKSLKRKDHDRTIPLKEEMLGALATYIQKNEIKSKLWMMTPQAVHHELKSIVDKAGLPHWIHIHTFRHSFAVHCLESGITINTLKELMGHANVENTMVYLKVFQPEIREQFDKVTF